MLITCLGREICWRMMGGAGLGGLGGDLAFSEPRGLYATCFSVLPLQNVWSSNGYGSPSKTPTGHCDDLRIGSLRS